MCKYPISTPIKMANEHLKPSMVVHALYPSTRETDTGGLLQIQGQPIT